MKEDKKTALELMRLEGLYKLVIDNIAPDILETRYLKITKKENVNDLKKAVKQCTKAQLIKIIDISVEIDDDLLSYAGYIRNS